MAIDTTNPLIRRHWKFFLQDIADRVGQTVINESDAWPHERYMFRWMERRLASIGEPELLSNPGPFSSTAGWTAHFTSTLSLEGDELRVTNDAGSDTIGRMVSPFSTVPGITYEVMLTRSAVGGQNAQAFLEVSNSADGSAAFASTGADVLGGSASLQFEATQATTHLSYRMAFSSEDVFVQLASASARRKG